MGKNIYRFILNLGLIISGSAMVFSGLLIQIRFHMGHHGIIALNDTVFGMNYEGWSDIHKISILGFTMLMIYHLYLHWKLYKAVIKKKLISRHRQVMLLSALFVFVAFTGYVPWFVDLFKGDEMLRKLFIEIHDKLTLLFAAFLILHIVQRLRWFYTTFMKMTGTRSQDDVLIR